MKENEKSKRSEFCVSKEKFFDGDKLLLSLFHGQSLIRVGMSHLSCQSTPSFVELQALDFGFGHVLPLDSYKDIPDRIDVESFMNRVVLLVVCIFRKVLNFLLLFIKFF